MKPNFESPVHTAGDLVERDITLYLGPRTEIWKHFLMESEIPEYRKIGHKMFIPASWEQFYFLTKNEMLR